MPFARVQLEPGPVNAEEANRIQGNIERAVAMLEKPTARLTVTFAAANVDVRLAHNLGRPLVGYKPIRLTAPMIIYDGSVSTTPAAFANVRSSAIGTATLEVF